MTIDIPDAHTLKLLNSDDVYRVMHEVLHREEKIDQEKEHFWMIGLATNNRILYIELVSLGSVNATTVEPMNVFRVAVLKGAVKVIMTHNHPSGELKPSDSDKDLTDRLIQVGKILNIEVIDHLILSLNSYLSFADLGLIEELEKSIKWVPQYALVERIRREEKKLRDEALKTERQKAKVEKERAVEKSKKEEKEEIALNILQEGLPVYLVAKFTGLSGEEVEKLKGR